MGCPEVWKDHGVSVRETGVSRDGCPGDAWTRRDSQRKVLRVVRTPL